MERFLQAVTTAETVAVVVSNVVPLVGIVGLGWSPSVVLGIYAAELGAICLWSLVKIPFARKRPNNYLKRTLNDPGRFELLGPLQAKRGATPLPGPLPPVYVRNLPTFVSGLVVAPAAFGLGFVLFALTRPTITEAAAGALLFGTASVFVSRGIEVWSQYFRGNGYRRHSPRSVLLTPFRHLIVVGSVFALFAGLETISSGPVLTPYSSVLLLVAGKFGYDLRTLWIDRDENRRGLFAKLYGSERTEIDPEQVTTPDRAPETAISMRRPHALADALAAGSRYLVGAPGLFAAAILFVGVLAESSRIVLAGVGVALTLAGVRAATRYLRYGTLEYRCYDDLLVVYDRLLDEPQAKTFARTVADVTVSKGWLDRMIGTETIRFEADDDTDLPMELFVPDPENVDTADRANRSASVTLPHVQNTDPILDRVDFDRRR